MQHKICIISYAVKQVKILNGVRLQTICNDILMKFQLSFGLLSTFYWIYYLVIANELDDALREMDGSYTPRTDDNRFVDRPLERVGMIR